MFGAILKATNNSFQKGMIFCRSTYVKKVMKLLAFIFEQPSYVSIYLSIYEDHLESSKHGITTPQCIDKMLSNNTFLETRIQRLLDGLIFVETGLGVHVQHMLKMSRGLYTGGDCKQNTWKSEGKLGTLYATN